MYNKLYNDLLVSIYVYIYLIGKKELKHLQGGPSREGVIPPPKQDISRKLVSTFLRFSRKISQKVNYFFIFHFSLTIILWWRHLDTPPSINIYWFWPGAL